MGNESCASGFDGTRQRGGFAPSPVVRVITTVTTVVLVAGAGAACQAPAANRAAAQDHRAPASAIPTPTKSAAQSVTATASPTPSSPAISGWLTYVNSAGGYSLSYPPNWYQIPNPNTPNDYPASFSNENAGYWPRSTPQVGTPNNVF